MEIEYELTVDDRVEFNILYLEYSPSGKRVFYRIRYIALFGIILIFAVGIPWLKSTSLFHYLLLTIVAAFGLVRIVWFSLSPQKMKKSLKRFMEKGYRKENLNTDIGKRKMIVSADGLHEISPFGESKTLWGAVGRIVETDTLVAIFIGIQNAYIIPKRAFPDEAKCREFIETAKKYHADAAREK